VAFEIGSYEGTSSGVFATRRGRRDLDMSHLVKLNNDSFDYEIVSADQAKTLRRLAIDVQARGRVLTRMAIGIGRDLLTAKAFLDHCYFED
jgi:hypothetical protein